MLSIIKSGFSWLIGSLLFLFISLKIFFSEIIGNIKQLIKTPEVHHFRENDYIELPKLAIGEEDIIFAGELPSMQKQVVSYDLKSVISQSAKQILVSARLETSLPGESLECTYNLYCDDENFGETHFYLFSNPFNEKSELNYSQALFWCAIPSSKELSIQLIDIFPAQTYMIAEGSFEVIGWK